jgi:hypothetical protein
MNSIHLETSPLFGITLESEPPQKGLFGGNIERVFKQLANYDTGASHADRDKKVAGNVHNAPKPAKTIPLKQFERAVLKFIEDFYGEEKIGSLPHGFHGIYYSSPELLHIEFKAGKSLLVEVRANTSDARTIFVRVPTEESLLVVPASKPLTTREVIARLQHRHFTCKQMISTSAETPVKKT